MKDQNSDKNPKSGFVPEAVRSAKHGSYKKKSGNNNSLNSEATNFKGLGFCIGRDGAKIYETTVDKLALYTSTQFKNGSDVVVCLRGRRVRKNGSTSATRQPYRKRQTSMAIRDE